MVGWHFSLFINDTSKYKMPSSWKLRLPSPLMLPSTLQTPPYTCHTLAAGSCSSSSPLALVLWITSGLCHVPVNTCPQMMVTSEFQWPSILLQFSCPHPRLPSRFCHNPELAHIESNTPLHVSTLTFSPSHSSDFMKTLSPQRLPFHPAHRPHSRPHGTVKR